ncbi:MAG: hypothetical protein HY717_07915 [Planctomycetes bacterium]|nr:hypothetical protein [Planctomycetota bacterium]
MKKLLLAFLPVISCSWPLVYGEEPAAKPPVQRQFTPAEVPSVGFPTDQRLGLPSEDYRLGPRDYHSLYWKSRQRPAYTRFWHYYAFPPLSPRGDVGYPGYYWGTPWFVPQSLRLKPTRVDVSDSTPLGLHNLYPPEDQFGLQIPVDEEEAIAPQELAISPAAGAALRLFKAARYAEAGKLLAAELKSPAVPPEVYLVTAELLVATGKFSSAAKLFRYGIEEAPDLWFLEGVDIARHFPSPEIFKERMKELGAPLGDDELHLLHASFRILSGDPAAIENLEELADPGLGKVAPAAKKLFLYFAEKLFETPAARKVEKKPEKPAAPKPEPERPKVPGF